MCLTILEVWSQWNVELDDRPMDQEEVRNQWVSALPLSRNHVKRIDESSWTWYQAMSVFNWLLLCRSVLHVAVGHSLSVYVPRLLRTGLKSGTETQQPTFVTLHSRSQGCYIHKQICVLGTSDQQCYEPVHVKKGRELNWSVKNMSRFVRALRHSYTERTGVRTVELHMPIKQSILHMGLLNCHVCAQSWAVQGTSGAFSRWIGSRNNQQVKQRIIK